MLIEHYALDWSHPALPEEASGFRLAAAHALRRASLLLSSLARHLAHAESRPIASAAPPVLEFHAEAGAPEGALYVDGRLVAHLAGIQRL